MKTIGPLSYPPRMVSSAQQGLACDKEGSIGIVSNPQIQIFSLLAGTDSFLFLNQKDLSALRENECV